MLSQVYFWGNWFVQNWLDALWLPLSLVCVHRGQRLKAFAFVVLCMMVMRLQIEIIESTSFSKGFTGLLSWPPIYRGYATYGFFILLFLILSWFSPRTSGPIYLAASLSIFFMAFTVSTVVLVF